MVKSNQQTLWLTLLFLSLSALPALSQNPCSPNPCQNGGICTPLSSTSFSCDCLFTGHNGPTCSNLIICPVVENEANAFWPQASALTLSWGICNPGYSGQPSRLCFNDGQFSNQINNPCVSLETQCAPDLYSNALWPATPVTQKAFGTCRPGYVSSSPSGPERVCKAGGTWESLVQHHCKRIVCEQENSGGATWPTTPSLVTVTSPCLTGLGSLSRTCGRNGEWDAVIGSCGQVSTVPCSQEVYARALWENTEPGEVATGNCNVGWEGAPTRLCGLDGRWQDLVRGHCQRSVCVEDDAEGLVWEQTVSLVTVRKNCANGISVERTCLGSGQWAPVAGSCDASLPQVPCEGGEYKGAFYPATHRGATVSGECVAGEGNVTRECASTGIWQEPIGECPSSPAPAK